MAHLGLAAWTAGTSSFCGHCRQPKSPCIPTRETTRRFCTNREERRKTTNLDPTANLEQDSSLAANATHDFLDCSVAFKDREQTAVKDRAHAITDRGPLDRGIIGTLEDQTVDCSRRHQQLGDRAAPAKAGAAARGAPHWVIQRNRFRRRQPRHV